jgi:hypothetical protein
MITGPSVEYECDECYDISVLEAPHVNGSYDCSDDAIMQEIIDDGWVYSEGVLMCDGCAGRLKNAA